MAIENIYKSNNEEKIKQQQGRLFEDDMVRIQLIVLENMKNMCEAFREIQKCAVVLMQEDSLIRGRQQPFA